MLCTEYQDDDTHLFRCAVYYTAHLDIESIYGEIVSFVGTVIQDTLNKRTSS